MRGWSQPNRNSLWTRRDELCLKNIKEPTSNDIGVGKVYGYYIFENGQENTNCWEGFEDVIYDCFNTDDCKYATSKAQQYIKVWIWRKLIWSGSQVVVVYAWKKSVLYFKFRI